MADQKHKRIKKWSWTPNGFLCPLPNDHYPKSISKLNVHETKLQISLQLYDRSHRYTCILPPWKRSQGISFRNRDSLYLQLDICFDQSLCDSHLLYLLSFEYMTFSLENE